MRITSEPIGSIPRSADLINAMKENAAGNLSAEALATLFDNAIAAVIKRMEETGAAVLTDGEQSKASFITYPLHGNKYLAADGVVIPFADGHTRQLPQLTAGPFKYRNYAVQYLNKAKKYTSHPVKQAVISASAISLIYPANGIENYSREQFIADLINETEKDIRQCLDAGAYNVQIDFTEARLAIKLDPSKQLLKMFIDLNNQVIDRFSEEEKKKIGVHTCPGGDHDSTHSADIPYAELLPLLFELHATNFYLEFAAEKDKKEVLEAIKYSLRPGQKVFIGVTDVLNPVVERPEEIRDLILLAAEYIPVEQLGTTDDCGFSPFADDTSTAQDIAFAKIKARIEGTKMAEEILNKIGVAV
ncbi:MAG: cobalamin-independent methionine synthase II family protein [Fimbriimonadaceae bacterium]|nr:cobalamin-independent methionine synthase II family protein [Chitinophagales bacterium]